MGLALSNWRKPHQNCTAVFSPITDSLQALFSGRGVLLRTHREKVFGPGRQVPLDRNQKARITAYAKAWDRLHRQPGQKGGALGRAALDVLNALLWVFHNSRSGCCFPSYERIAEKAGCARSTVAAAIKALELARVLTWQNRLVRIRERCADLFGRTGWRWRVLRKSNAYVFRDPAAKSDQRTGTPNQETQKDGKGDVTPLIGRHERRAAIDRDQTGPQHHHFGQAAFELTGRTAGE